MICQLQQNPFPAASAACAAAAPLDAPSLARVAAIPQPRSLAIGPSCVPHAARPPLPSSPPVGTSRSPAPQAACAASLPAPPSPLPAAAAVLASLPAAPPPATARAAAVAGSAPNSQPYVPPFSTAVHPAVAAAPVMQARCYARHSRGQVTRRVKRAGQPQRETDHCTPRRSPPASRHCSATAAAAVLLFSLCVVGVAATLQDVTTCPKWSTAALSAARSSLAATSLPSQGLALFAGGFTGMRFLFELLMMRNLRFLFG
jgi:hypothetical protein